MDETVAYGCTVNRELSWLAFDQRVLEEAALPSRPPLDRLTFLGIFLSNLDEFFRVRVGTLVDQCAVEPPPIDDKTGWTPAQQLAAVVREADALMARAGEVGAGIRAALAERGVVFARAEALDGPRAAAMARFFKDELKPLLSPLAIDAHHPFPFIRDREAAVVSRLGKRTLGVIPLGRLPRLRVFSDAAGHWALHTDDVVRFFAPKLYGRRLPDESVVCRVTRNADLTVEEREGEGDFRGAMRDFLRRRKRLAPVRVQFAQEPSPELGALLRERLGLPPGVEPRAQALPLDPAFAFGLAKALPPETARALSAAPRRPVPVAWAQGEIAARVREKDRLLHFPFESIAPFVRLLEQAADDPRVTAIRITLYRLAANSRIAQALARAAENGKDVLCVLELRARFDEENNINYSEMLQEAGCTVIYGLPGYKVHAKVCLILYNDGGDEPRTLTQIGTGNYNEKTAAQYTDLSYLTADPAIGRDAIRLFRALCLGEPEVATDRLWVAPKTFLPRLLEQLDEEIAEARAGRPAQAFLKVNSLNNRPLIHKLIEASQAGVDLTLHVRGICCVRPGIPGKTDRLTVRSVVGDSLEHTRLLCFGAPGRERLFIGSGDFLNRNLNRRVEVYTPILDPDCRDDLLALIRILRADTAKARVMAPDATYALPAPSPRALSSQDALRARYAELNATPIPPPGAPRPTLLALIRRLLRR